MGASWHNRSCIIQTSTSKLLSSRYACVEMQTLLSWNEPDVGLRRPLERARQREPLMIGAGDIIGHCAAANAHETRDSDPSQLKNACFQPQNFDSTSPFSPARSLTSIGQTRGAGWRMCCVISEINCMCSKGDLDMLAR